MSRDQAEELVLSNLIARCILSSITERCLERVSIKEHHSGTQKSQVPFIPSDQQQFACAKKDIEEPRLRQSSQENKSFEWPTGRYFSLEIGRQKIAELINQKWRHPSSLTFTVEIIGLFVTSSVLQYKYRVRWQKGDIIAFVYFNIDVKRCNLDEPVKLSYIFQNDTTVHTPRSSNFHIRWIQCFDNYSPRPSLQELSSSPKPANTYPMCFI